MFRILSRQLQRIFSAALAFSLVFCGLPFFASQRVYADSGYVTADQIRRALRQVSSGDTAAINALVEAACNLSTREKERLTRQTIEDLADYYNGREWASVDNDRYSSSAKMPDKSYSYGASFTGGRGAGLDVYQESSGNSGTADLRFSVTLNGKEGLKAPAVLYIALPDNFKTSNDYDIKDNDGRRSASIQRSGDTYYAVFTVQSLGEMRLIRDSNSSSSSGSHSKPSGNASSAYWDAVIDAIWEAPDGARVRVNIGGRSTVDAQVLRELRGRAVTLTLTRSDGDSVSIYGKQVGTVPGNKDYYTFAALKSEYGSGSTLPGPVPTPFPDPAATAFPTPTPSAPPALPLLPVSSVPSSSAAPVTPTATPAPVSSAPEEEEPDIEIVAEEDDPPESEPPQQPEPEEAPASADGEQDDGFFAILAVLSVVGVVLVAAIITVFMWNRRKG